MLNNFFFCAGPPRSGTTWLYEMMKDHPDLHLPVIKEVGYFMHKYSKRKRVGLTEKFRMDQFIRFVDRTKDCDLKIVIDSMDWWKQYLGGPINDDWYFKLFDGVKSGQWCADFTPSTFYMPDVGWSFIKKIPNVKIIIISRDPLERFWSGFKQKIDHLGYDELLHELTKEEYKYLIEKLEPYKWPPAESDSIEEVSKRILTHITEENFRVYEFEEIMNNPIGMLKNIEDFIGIRNIDYRDNQYFGMAPNPSTNVKIPDWFMDESS
jgi:hypothetical protein